MSINIGLLHAMDEFEDSNMITVDHDYPFIVKLNVRKSDRFKKLFRNTYDKRVLNAFEHVTNCLVRSTGANFGYYSSSSIVLVFFKTETYSQNILIGTVVQKIVSATASNATNIMAQYMFRNNFFENVEDAIFPTFDCKVFNVPNLFTLSKYIESRIELSKSSFIHNMFRKRTGKVLTNVNTKTMLATLNVLDIDIFEDASPAAIEGMLIRRELNPEYDEFEKGVCKYLYISTPAKDFFKTPNREKLQYIKELSA